MLVKFTIEEFGKIKSAKIELTNLVFFVGNNNSGKTMLMQLIYGLRKELSNIDVITNDIKKSEYTDRYLLRYDSQWFSAIECYINKYLDDNKLQIVKNIFGMMISVGKIEISLDYSEEEFFVCNISEINDKQQIDVRYYYGNNTSAYTIQVEKNIEKYKIEKIASKNVWKSLLIYNKNDGDELFLPASRSGLQLLYKYYFAGNYDSSMVSPIKDFMQFTQLYSNNLDLSISKKKLLEFGEENLLNGHIHQEGEESFYVDKLSGKTYPIYIASSMIHELTPFIKAISSTKKISWLFCDEVENSLHPLIQREMARWIIRMVNEGMHILISSHSDSMASRLNNLLILSNFVHKSNKYEILQDLELQEADLLSIGKSASVYEFCVDKDCKTNVKQLDFIESPKIGYEFSLFEKNIEKLYQEADRIMR